MEGQLNGGESSRGRGFPGEGNCSTSPTPEDVSMFHSECSLKYIYAVAELTSFHVGIQARRVAKGFWGLKPRLV